MSNWGNQEDRSSMPNWLSEQQKNRCVLTERGWEIQPEGNDNPASSEVIVALGGSPKGGVVNDAPTIEGDSIAAGLTTGFRGPRGTIVGVSGAEIIPVRFEVFDLESLNQNMQITIDGNFPAGLTVGVGSFSDYGFEITGTPTQSTTANTIVEFMDGGSSGISAGVGLTIGLQFNLNITT